MKKLLVSFVLCLCLAGMSVEVVALTTSCSIPPSQRVVTVQTLKAVGQSAETAVSVSAQLYQSGQITAAQARQVMDFYDNKFQPSYRIAVSAANADLSSVASPDLLTLASQLSNLVSSLQKK